MKTKRFSFVGSAANIQSPSTIPEMKKLRQLLQSLFSRQRTGRQPIAQARPVEEPAADLEMIRFSVWQYLRAAKPTEQLILFYSSKYDAVMDELRMEGWMVRLQVVSDGSLAYVISADPSRMFA